MSTPQSEENDKKLKFNLFPPSLTLILSLSTYLHTIHKTKNEILNTKKLAHSRKTLSQYLNSNNILYQKRIPNSV